MSNLLTKIKTIIDFIKIKTVFGMSARLDLYEKLQSAAEDGISVLDRIRQIHTRLSAAKDLQAPILRKIIINMDSGATFSEALQSYAPLQERLLITSGEERNNISESLKHLVEMMRATNAIFDKILLTFLNIMLRLGIIIIAIYVITSVLGPQIEASLNKDSWPVITEFFFVVSGFLNSWGLFVLILLMVFFVLIWKKTPLFYLYRLSQSAYLLVSLSALTSAGVPFNDALIKVRRGANAYVKKHIIEMLYMLKNGVPEGVSMNTGMLPKKICDDLSDYSELQGFSSALGRIGKEAHQTLNRWLLIASNTVDWSSRIIIFGYLLWFFGAVAAAAMSSFTTIKF